MLHQRRFKMLKLHTFGYADFHGRHTLIFCRSAGRYAIPCRLATDCKTNDI